MAFRDVCTGPQCSNTCPEEIILSAETAETWSGGARIAIAVIVLTIAAICLLLKVSVCSVCTRAYTVPLCPLLSAVLLCVEKASSSKAAEISEGHRSE